MPFLIEHIDLGRVMPAEFEGSGFWARVVAGEHQEVTCVPSAFWSVADYESQWATASQRLRAGNRAVFLTSLVAPIESPQLLRMWAAAKGSMLRAQEWMVDTEDFPGISNLENLVTKLMPDSVPADDLFDGGVVFLCD